LDVDPDAKMIAHSSRRLPREWRFVAAIASACFLVAFVLFHYAVPTGWLSSTPVSAFGAAALAVLAAVGAALYQIGRLRVHNRQMRMALENISQGLCMFDADERLMVCNRRYMEMYKVPPEAAKPGTTLADLLEYRIAHGSFARDVDSYRRELLASMAHGDSRASEVKSADGRTIFITNRPMADGGWVATHEDVTERRDAEAERAALAEQQQRRSMVEQAIAAFRKRVEEHLRTVGDGAMTMRTTATTLSPIPARPPRAPKARSPPPTRPAAMWRPRRSRPTN
jgi:methyl-accepting chemotaxis protein